MPQTTPNVYNAVPALHERAFEILTIAQVCDDCNAGTHPAIPSGLTGHPELVSAGWQCKTTLYFGRHLSLRYLHSRFSFG